MPSTFSLTGLLLRICNPAGSFASGRKRKSTSASPTYTPTALRRRKKTTLPETKTSSNDAPNSSEPLSLSLSETTTLGPPSRLSQLPPEIMAEIFALAAHATSYKFHSDKKRHLRTTPLTLGHVCAEWRAIAWAAPHVWSHVSLVLSTTRYETQMTLLRAWIARSGVCPLHINLLFANEYEWAGRMPTELVEVLVGTAHRWRQVYFVLPEAWYPALAPIERNMPLLVKASTQPLWSDCGLPSSRRMRFALFQYAPALKDMHLNGYYLTDVQIPWAQLTAFTMQHVYLDECLYGLARTTNITYCRIYTILDNDVGRIIHDFPTRLELPISELIVYSAAWSDNARLLANLALPELKTMELCSLKGPPELGDLPYLVMNLGCQLQKLKLTEFTCFGEELGIVSALQQITTLRSLEISLNQGISVLGYDFFPKLLQLHSTPESVEDTNATEDSAKDAANGKVQEERVPPDEIYLGKLEEFKFSGDVTVEKAFPLEKKLLEALRVRMKLSCLRSFELSTSNAYEYRVDQEIKAEFRELRKSGMRLRIAFGEASWLS